MCSSRQGYAEIFLSLPWQTAAVSSMLFRLYTFHSQLAYPFYYVHRVADLFPPAFSLQYCLLGDASSALPPSPPDAKGLILRPVVDEHEGVCS